MCIDQRGFSEPGGFNLLGMWEGGYAYSGLSCDSVILSHSAELVLGILYVQARCNFAALLEASEVHFIRRKLTPINLFTGYQPIKLWRGFGTPNCSTGIFFFFNLENMYSCFPNVYDKI